MTELPLQLIKLEDGTYIDPSTREPIALFKKEVAAKDAPPEPDDVEDDDVVEQGIVPLHRRSIMDLKLTAAQMAVVNNVLVYTLWGLPEDEIAMQCGCSVHHVAVVRDLDEYKRMFDALVEGMRAHLASTVQGLLHEAAPKAAKGIIRNLKNKSQDIRIAAQKDILDRTGHRPADRVEHTHQFLNGSELTIRVIKQDDKSLPSMDLKANA